MSRTTFAVRFESVAGVAPLAHLAGWRMRLAQRSLREDGASIAERAASLGDTPESAFSKAFKRVTGTAPRNHRNAASRPQPGHAFDLEVGPRAAAERRPLRRAAGRSG